MNDHASGKLSTAQFSAMLDSRPVNVQRPTLKQAADQKLYDEDPTR